jgi:hypothetical protein
MYQQTILTIVFIIFFILIIVASYFEAKKNSKQTVKKGQLTSKPHNGKTEKTSPPEEVDEGLPPEKLVAFDKDIDKILGLIGIAEPVDSIALIDDVLNDKLNDVALKIARKMSIMHPRIIIQKETETEKDEQGREIVASVLVGANNEAVFGTNEFNYQTIRIKSYPGHNAYPDKFIYTIAHELSHKILHSLDRGRSHNEQDERETDIAAVLSGFGNSYITAKNLDEGLGYLKTDEAQYLKQKADKVLAHIKEARSSQYKEYVRFRQQNEEKIRFLNALYNSDSLRNEDEWEIDYAKVGEDYNKLLVCTKSIDVKALKRYKELCDYFKNFGGPLVRYSVNAPDSKNQLDELRNIIYNLQLPDFEYLGLLKRYSD